jgi:hypothetical protein
LRAGKEKEKERRRWAALGWKRRKAGWLNEREGEEGV